jgi:hypothetical protein
VNLNARLPFMRETRTRSFRFLKDRRTVNNSPGFEDLMKRYINEQGGFEAIVKYFR